MGTIYSIVCPNTNTIAPNYITQLIYGTCNLCSHSQQILIKMATKICQKLLDNLEIKYQRDITLTAYGRSEIK